MDAEKCPGTGQLKLRPGKQGEVSTFGHLVAMMNFVFQNQLGFLQALQRRQYSIVVGKWVFSPTLILLHQSSS